MKTTNNFLRLLAAVLLVSSFVTMGFPSGGQSVVAQSTSKPALQIPPPETQGSKISSDLQDAFDHAPERLVRVIVDTTPSPTSSAFFKLRARISEMGGTVIRSLNGGQTTSVEIAASALQALASDNGVKYICPDRATQVAGHLETTTGAAAARSYGTTATGTIDGNGVGIAILDSGIYSAHHSFQTGRVVASVDFTGEGRTDDPFGHGTHVAAVAAGNSHVSAGAYTGVAPRAKLINVRVLDSLGRGSLSTTIAGIDWCIAN